MHFFLTFFLFFSRFEMAPVLQRTKFISIKEFSFSKDSSMTFTKPFKKKTAQIKGFYFEYCFVVLNQSSNIVNTCFARME